MSRGWRLKAEESGEASEEKGVFGVGQAVRVIGVVCPTSDQPAANPSVRLQMQSSFCEGVRSSVTVCVAGRMQETSGKIRFFILINQ